MRKLLRAAALGCLMTAILLPLLFGTALGNTFEPIRVMVSILPQAYFVDRIGGDRVLTNVLVLPGKSPATYAPSPLQISGLAKSKLFFRIGVPFETALLAKIGDMGGRLVVVDTRQGIQLRKMETGVHGHDLKESVPIHDQDGLDPHIWLDPKLVMQQAKTIGEALIQFDPSGKSTYHSHVEAFIEDLARLDKTLKQILAPFKGRNLYVFHPSFGYLADAYGLHQIPIEVEGKAPKGKDLHRFIQSARSSRARVIFVQPQFDRHAARKIAAAIQGEVVTLDPLAADYLQNMEAMALAIAGALGRQDLK